MKLNEISTDKFGDVICTIAPAITELTKDDAVLKAVATIASAYQRKNAGLIAYNVVLTALPALLNDKNRVHVYTVISAMTGKTMDEVKAQPIPDTVHDVQDFFDTDFSDLFTSAVPAAK